LKKDPDGLEHYQLRIEEPPVTGVVRARVEDGSWHLKGVGPGPREPTSAPAQEDALKAFGGESQPGESDPDLEAPAREGSTSRS